MKKRILSMLLAIVMVVGLVPGFAITASAADITPSQPVNGDGSAGNPYQIGTAAELYWFAQTVNSGNTTICAELMNNITVNTDVVNPDGSLGANVANFTVWTPIGHQTGTSSNSYAFKGTFDGNGHTISGLYFDSSIHSDQTKLNSQAYKGLFGYVGGATIKNVTVADSYFYGTQQVGGIVGQAGYSGVSPNPQIINCHIVNSSINGTSNVGGIVGLARNSALIESCTNAGYVTGKNDAWNNKPGFIGGIVGYLGVNSTVTDCHNIGVVNSADQRVGGVVGVTAGTVTVQKSSNTGTVSGTNYVSGVVGYVNTGSVSITDCYNAGAITATGNPGYARGIVYDAPGSSDIKNCHNYGSVTGANVTAIVSGTNSSNCYYLDSLGLSDTNATVMSADKFADGTVVDLLNAGRSDAVWMQGEQYPVFKPAHTHEWQYTATDTTITATCKDTSCGESGGSVSIALPANTEYTGNPIKAMVENQLVDQTATVSLSYTPADKLTDGYPVKIGTYTATLTVGEGENAPSISVTYTITHSNHDLDYTDNGNGTHTELCTCGHSASMPHTYNEDTHLCACKDVEQFTVTYTDGVEDAVIFQDVVVPVDYGAPTPSFSADPTRTGYTFNGWTPTVAETVTENATYTAQWTAHTYTVKFDANGGTGSMAAMNFTYGESQNLTANAFTYTNMHFTGWNTVANGSGTAYTNEQSVSNLLAENDGVVTLYAQWSDKSAQTITLDTSDRNAIYGDGTLAAREIAASGAITYSSSDESVATVDENGVITVLKVGDTIITATAAETAEYASGSVSYKLIVAPKTLTITADSHEVYVGSRQPELTCTVDGLVHGDTLETAPSCTTDANMYRAGTYTIVPGGADAGDNYSITYVNGTLTVKMIYIPIIPSNPTYPPIVDDSENGDVVVTPKNPEKGDTVVITPDPDAGYEVDEVIVTDKNGNPVTVIDNGDGTYSFKQPSGKVNIEVTFKEIVKVCPRDWTCPMYGYADLDMTAWYHDGVHFCIEHGLMQGVGNNEFAPNGTTTRAMIVTILWRLEGSPIVNYAMDFEDVAADQWYTEAIRWAASEKIVEGYGNGYFGTNDAITREQFVTIMFRYAKYKGYDVSVGENTNILSYDDAFDVAEWAIPAMQWACGSGMIQGIADGDMMNLAPQGNATRAQAAAILQRFCENVANKK